MEGKFNIPVRSPMVVRAGTALESIQKERERKGREEEMRGGEGGRGGGI